jgi:hypothetical protein
MHHAADAAELTELERRQLFHREILSEYAFQNLRDTWPERPVVPLPAPVTVGHCGRASLM